MNKFIILFLFNLFFSTLISAQNRVELTGVVVDEYNHPLSTASVLLDRGKFSTTTNRKGIFTFSNVPLGKYRLNVSFVGYKYYTDSLTITGGLAISITLSSLSKQLNEVSVSEQLINSRKRENSLSVTMVDQTFLTENRSGSLMQTLSRLPGVSSMNIGSGQSKPVIRGMGFNRVVVAENGVKHEAQEWGADHGLEIDQFTVERVEVVKGPASLMYGANAMGGVIDLKQIATPNKNSQGGTVLLNTHTNSNLYGVSAKYFVRKDQIYFKTHFSMSDYADYKVPTDSIEYRSYYFKLKNNRSRNTAGKEQSAGVILGYLNQGFSSHLSVSDLFSKSGFFANAHGVEIRNSSIDYDSSARDIDLPSQQVNHFKVLSNTIWQIQDYKLNLDLAFQNNYRQEFSERVSHGYMPTPPDSLERLYNKNSWTGNFRFEFPKHGKHHFTTGINNEYQQNKIGGWGFMLPAYQSFLTGGFMHDKIYFSEKWMVNAGLRYDFGILNTEAYHDWFTTPQANGDQVLSQRSIPLHRTFGSVSGGLGATYVSDSFSAKINAGKGFRMPTAKELGSNGINYHMYRYEKGDTTLHAEQSYQLDMEMSWKIKKLTFEISPFVNYFPNYIYLNPTANYFEAQQVYYHSESEVFRTGGECTVAYQFSKQFQMNMDLEYIYSIQLSGEKKGYTLPFSPPMASVIGAKYSPNTEGWWQHPTIGIEIKLLAAQNSIVPPEKKTDGCALLNLSAGTGIKVGKHVVQLNAQAQNILDTKYYDHTSFYRLIEVPGQGRNFVINLQFAF